MPRPLTLVSFTLSTQVADTPEAGNKNLMLSLSILNRYGRFKFGFTCLQI